MPVSYTHLDVYKRQGQLHMGHAMDATLQDILIRFKRMQGYEALWLPGTDHAGIATQIKVCLLYTSRCV